MLDIKDFHDVPVVFDKPDYQRAHDARCDELDWCLENYVPKGGVVLEFGVFEGKTINHMAKQRPDVQFYGFDSFDGLPEDWDLGGKRVAKERFKVKNLPKVPDNVTLIEGFFDQILVNWLVDEWMISEKAHDPVERYMSFDFVNLDADLYSSTAYVLDKLNPFITSKTLLRFDELCEWRIEPFYTKKQQKQDRRIPQGKYTKWKEGEWKALNEWVENYEREVKPVARNYSQSSVMEVIK